MKEEFKRLLKQLKKQTYTSSKLEVITDFFEPAEFVEKISDDETIKLAEALKKNPHITNIHIVNQDVGDIGAAALAKVETITNLDLQCNNIHITGIKALASSKLKLLSLRENMDIFGQLINSDMENDFLTIIMLFNKNDTIRELNLQRTFIPNKFAAELLLSNTAIKTLNLSDNYLTDEALKYIANNKTIEYLDLSENNITDIGAEYISKNTNLQTLVLSKSKITDKGAYFLSKHSALKELYMLDNNITIQGLKYILANTLKKNNQLEKVVARTDYKKIPEDVLLSFYRKFAEIKAQQAIELLKTANEDDPIETIVLVGNTDEPEDS